MFYKTISNNCIFVISLLFLCFTVSSCTSGWPQSGKKEKNFSKQFGRPKVVGRIKSREIAESSGLVASRCNEGILWTHNDSRNGAFIYAIDNKGRKVGTWKVSGATNFDWEDIAASKNEKGECFLYIGDIGNNLRNRSELTIYRIKEPKVSKKARASDNEKPFRTKTAKAITFSYPKVRRNAETLMIHPKTGDIYILSKRLSGASGVYKLPANRAEGNDVLQKVGDFSVPALPNGLLTGGEISPDGKRVILCDYFNAYEITLPDDEKNFDEIWKEDPSIIKLGKRDQGEAICYSPDATSIYATSENRNSPLIKVERE